VSSFVLAGVLLAAADILVVGLLADPVTLVPHRATDLVSQAIVVNTCETLVRERAETGRPEGTLATTWATPDHRVWTFTLREGVRFHDGTPFDATAVVANVESLRRERGFPGVAERLGSHVVRLVLERANASLLSTLSQPYFAMQSPRALEDGRQQAVGTGPFRLASARPGLVELQAFAGHRGGVPRLARLAFRRFASEDALVKALLAAEVDATSALSPGRVDTLRRHHEVTIESFTGLNVAFLAVNNERAPWSDVRVRHAASRAIDRDGVVSRFLQGHGEPARTLLPPSLLGRPALSRDLVFDRAGAARLLTEAGLASGFATTLLTVDAPRPYLPAPLLLAADLRESLAAVGIAATPRQAASWSDYLDRVTRGDYDLALLGWQADSTDPNDFLSALLGSEAIGATNRSRYRSAAMDGLLKRGRRESEAADREALYREAQVLFQKDMPFLPLYHVSVFTAQRRVVRGVIRGPTGLSHYDRAFKLE
jgi:ABC-type transport system substrate-binding protein